MILSVCTKIARSQMRRACLVHFIQIRFSLLIIFFGMLLSLSTASAAENELNPEAKDFYERLGISEKDRSDNPGDAIEELAKKAHRKAVRIYHPDRVTAPRNPDEDEEAYTV